MKIPLPCRFPKPGSARHGHTGGAELLPLSNCSVSRRHCRSIRIRGCDPDRARGLAPSGSGVSRAAAIAQAQREKTPRTAACRYAVPEFAGPADEFPPEKCSIGGQSKRRRDERMRALGKNVDEPDSVTESRVSTGVTPSFSKHRSSNSGSMDHEAWRARHRSFDGRDDSTPPSCVKTASVGAGRQTCASASHRGAQPLSQMGSCDNPENFSRNTYGEVCSRSVHRGNRLRPTT